MAVDPTERADPSFVAWARDVLRPSIWKGNHHNVQEASQHFISIFRPILVKAFYCIQLGCKYTNLLSSVKIRAGNEVHVPDPEDDDITCPDDVHDIFRALRNLLDIALNGEPSVEDVPSVMMLKHLCSKALSCSNMTELRVYGQFISLNPLIYGMEWYMFVVKTRFICDPAKSAHPSFLAWARDSRRPSIWVNNGVVQESSPHFLSIFSPQKCSTFDRPATEKKHSVVGIFIVTAIFTYDNKAWSRTKT